MSLTFNQSVTLNTTGRNLLLDGLQPLPQTLERLCYPNQLLLLVDWFWVRAEHTFEQSRKRQLKRAFFIVVCSLVRRILQESEESLLLSPSLGIFCLLLFLLNFLLSVLQLVTLIQKSILSKKETVLDKFYGLCYFVNNNFNFLTFEIPFS